MDILVRILAVLMTIAILVVMFSVGFILLAIITGIVAVTVLVLFLQGKLQRFQPPRHHRPGEPDDSRPTTLIIETEYHEISDNEEEKK